MQFVLSNKIFTAQEFINAILGDGIYKLTEADNDDLINAIHNILRYYDKEDDDCNTIWDYPLNEIDEIVAQETRVVLVDVSHFENGEYIKDYRWFEVPDIVAQPDEFELDIENEYQETGLSIENKDIIYTHDKASQIIEYFEVLLEKHKIKIPSPEDDERDEDNEATLYGSVYSDLLDNIEAVLIEILTKTKDGSDIIPYEFSGNY